MRDLRVVNLKPCLEEADAGIIHLNKRVVRIEKESLQLNRVVVSTETMLEMLIRIVVMLEHKRRKTALLDPLPWPILARQSPSDLHPLSLRMHPTHDGIINSRLRRLHFFEA